MDDLDRFFITEISRVICANHSTVAIGLYNAGVKSNETATELLFLLNDNMSVTEASDIVQQDNISARVQGIIIARLLSEQFAAMEDFSAFCYAIKKRQYGIMKQYYNVGEKLNSFLDEILIPENEHWDLHNILDLPTLDDLKKHFNPEIYERIDQEYRHLSECIRRVAKHLRMMEPESTTTEIDHNESIQIIYNMIHKEEIVSNSPTSGFIVRLYNKIKHRFMYIESMDKFNQLETDYTMKFGYYSRKPDDVRSLFDSIHNIGYNMHILAQLLLWLDKEGVCI